MYISPKKHIDQVMDLYCKKKNITNKKYLGFLCNGINLVNEPKTKEIKVYLIKYSNKREIPIVINDFSDLDLSNLLTE